MIPLSMQATGAVLCLGAHADDIEIGCGGAVLKLLQANPELEIHWHVFSGAAERVDEAKRSAEAFLAGAPNAHIAIHGFRDSYFPTQWGEIKECIESIRSCNPEVIFTHHERDLHQDHRVLAELTRCAFRDRVILEYEIPKYDGDLGQPNTFVNLPVEIAEQKVGYLLEHFPSQRSRYWFTEDLFQGLMRVRGIESASPTGFAEAFHCRKLTIAF